MPCEKNTEGALPQKKNRGYLHCTGKYFEHNRRPKVLICTPIKALFPRVRVLRAAQYFGIVFVGRILVHVGVARRT